MSDQKIKGKTLAEIQNLLVDDFLVWLRVSNVQDEDAETGTVTVDYDQIYASRKAPSKPK